MYYWVIKIIIFTVANNGLDSAWDPQKRVKITSIEREIKYEGFGGSEALCWWEA